VKRLRGLRLCAIQRRRDHFSRKLGRHTTAAGCRGTNLSRPRGWCLLALILPLLVLVVTLHAEKHYARHRPDSSYQRQRFLWLELHKTESIPRSRLIAKEPQASAAWGSPYPLPRYSGRTRRSRYLEWPRPVADAEATHSAFVDSPEGDRAQVLYWWIAIGAHTPGTMSPLIPLFTDHHWPNCSRLLPTRYTTTLTTNALCMRNRPSI
jgi:hypothetical protein